MNTVKRVAACLLASHLGFCGTITQNFDGSVNASSFGALCNNSHDDGSALNAALQYQAAHGGGSVLIPGSICGTLTTVTVLQGTQLVGVNVATSAISALPGFSASAPVVSLGGVGCTAAQDAMSIERMTVATNGQIAIQSTCMEEQSFIRNVSVWGYSKYGIDLSTYGIQNCHISDIYSSPSVPGGIAIHLSNAEIRMAIEKLTVFGPSVGPATTGILLENSSDAALRDIHCEGMVDCIKIDTGSTALIENIWGNPTDQHLVHFTNTSGGGELLHVTPGGSQTTLLDDISSTSITAQNMISFHVVALPGGNTLSTVPTEQSTVSLLRLSPSTEDPGCKTLSDMGKMWNKSSVLPTVFQTCQQVHGTSVAWH